MDARTLAMVVVSLLALVACERSEPSKPAPTQATKPAPATTQAPANAALSFVNKVWQVAESGQVAPGSTRVFLADGTLVMAAPHATPAFGAWRYDDGRLTITEEGQDYPTDILALSDSTFRIRMHSPGEPVEMLLELAEHPPMAAIAEAKPAAVATLAEIEPAVTLWGTAWRLESLAGADALAGTTATLEFPSEGRASGNGSCNHFNGVLTVEGSAIQFGGLAATRKACAEAAMRQEDAYFAALREAERFEIDGQSLRIFSADQAEPLRFVASQAPPAIPANQISRATATAMPALTGIWTVVSHHNTPGISALSDDQARAFYGETVRLTASAAISPGSRCSQPEYSARSESAEAYLASEFKLPPGGLKPLAGQTQIRLMEVTCGGAHWPALGALLLQIDRDRALAPWDGIFFELTRARDFRAVGQEPGWQLEMRQGAEMRFTFDYGKGSVVMPAARVKMDSNTGTRTYHTVAEANDLEVVIVPVQCNDSMSGRSYPATVTVTLNGRSFRGCGEELATPYQG